MRKLEIGLLLPLSLLLAGCYSHAAVRPQDAVPGSTVRARITATQAETLGEVLGREDRVLRGRVVGSEAGSLLLQVPTLAAGGGTRLQQRVALAPTDIVELEVRTLDRVRTGAFVAALTVAGGALMLHQFREDGADDPASAPKPGGGDQAIFAFRWRW